jgi:hypothetical protein
MSWIGLPMYVFFSKSCLRQLISFAQEAKKAKEAQDA